MKSDDKQKDKKGGNLMERFSAKATKFAGSSPAFAIALCTIVAWGISGPIFGYSDTWQLVINTGTTIITFLMVFLIQRTQNKDSMVIQLKLNELIAAKKGASNRLVNIENITEEELKVLHKYYEHLSEEAKKDLDIKTTHSIEEATELSKLKKKGDHKGVF